MRMLFFVKDYSTDLLFPLIMKWNNEAVDLYLSDVWMCLFIIFRLME